jgi:membrane protein implicated in regulation of membrane protease activity
MSNRSSWVFISIAIVLFVVSIPGLLFASHAVAKVVYAILVVVAAGLAAGGIRRRNRTTTDRA